MRLLVIIIFSTSLYGKDLTISFWNLQNLYDDKGDHNLEYAPINHPLKKKFCLKKKKSWEKKNCLYKHWTKEKYLKRIDSIQVEIKQFPESTIWCFCEVEKKSVVEKLFSFSEKYFIAGSEENKKGQNIFCAIDKALTTNIIYGRSFFLGANRRMALEINIRHKDKELSLVIVHLPSQFHQDVERRDVINRIYERYKNGKYFVIGDFNLRADELISVPLKRIQWHIRNETRGTYFYKKANKHHDFDLVFSNLKKVEASVLLPKKNIKSKGIVIPFAYSNKKVEGLSDHFPIRAVLKDYL